MALQRDIFGRLLDTEHVREKLDPFNVRAGFQWKAAERESAFRSLRVVEDPLLGSVLAALGMREDGSEGPFIARVLGPGKARGSRYELQLLSTWLTVDALGQGKGAGFEGAACVPTADLRECDCLLIRCGYKGEQQAYSLWVCGAVEEIGERVLRMALASPWRQQLHGTVLSDGRAVDVTRT